MNPTIQPGILDLIAQSGLMVKFVLLTLGGASVLCWAIIAMKWKVFRLAQKQNQEFVEVFWSGQSVEDILARIEEFPGSPIAHIFQMGIKELKTVSHTVSHNEGAAAAQQKLDQIHRSLNRTSNLELSEFEKHLGWLATTASAAPFIGLFGTVWGIMNSFQKIGATGAANLAVVAPGISEALVATAAGIGAAIPAVIAYNHFTGLMRRLASDLDGFSQDFVGVLQRSTTATSSASRESRHNGASSSSSSSASSTSASTPRKST